MHHLVPSYIIRKLRQGEEAGSLACAALFVDISGFTHVTEALTEHGQYGAEVLAGVMRSVFTPLVKTVFEQGGFVTGFAGDAFTAVFPVTGGRAPAEQRALAAASQMQQTMVAVANQITRYGHFNFSAKIGLSTGEASWAVLRSASDARATYYFRGEAIDQCADAEQHAQAGEIVCTDYFRAIVTDQVSCTPVAGVWRIDEIDGPFPPAAPVQPELPDVEYASLFVPRTLVERDIEGEFRQIFNLFISLQGDPTVQDLQRFVEQVFLLQEQFGGFLNRLDFGDKGCTLLLFWGAPVSHERDLAHVLDFILALRRASSIPLRAGVTYQIAHAGYIGSSLAEEYTCYGRGVNLAARLMAAAPWNELWVDLETAQRAQDQFVIESIGPREFKGFAAAQQVYRLLGPRETSSSRFAGKPFVGREPELELLRRKSQRIFEGGFGGAVTIIGEAGVGKSRLVDALCAPYAQQDVAAVFFCQADELLRQSLNPFRYFLARYFNQSADESETANLHRFQQQMARLLDNLADPELKAELERTQSFLAHLIGINWQGSLYEQLDPELRFDNTLVALKALFKAESLQRPLIIHLEDAHWWDQDTQVFLPRLAHNVEGYPFLLLITSREALSPSLFEPEVQVETIHLDRLASSAVTDLAAEILGQPPAPELTKLLVERTEGNPFFVEQLLLYLQEQDLLSQIKWKDQSSLGDDILIPTDVRAVLTARLDRLPYDIKDAVQQASVLGQEFETPILAEMIGPAGEFSAYLNMGEDERVWLPSGRSNYVFRHAMLRDAAYEMQLSTRLRYLHLRAAQAFEQRYPDGARVPHYGQIAYHFDLAEQVVSARYYYGAAAQHAKEAYSNEDAIAFFSRALSLTPSDDIDARRDYLCERETIYQWLGKNEERFRDLQEITELLAQTNRPDLRADLALRLSSHAFVTGDYETAVDEVKTAISEARRAANKELEARAYHRYGRTLVQMGQSSEAQSMLEIAIRYATQGSDEAFSAACYVELAGTLRQEGHYERARRLLDEALAIYKNLQDEQGLIRTLTLYGVLDNDLGRFTESEAYYQQALDLAHETGWRFAEVYILTNLGGTRFETGDFSGGREALTRALVIAEETGDLRTEGNCLDTLGMIAHYEGDFLKALSYYDRAAAILGTIENKRELGYVLTHAGYTNLELGEFEHAKNNLETALRYREELGAAALSMDSLAGLALLAMRQDQKEDAVKYVLTISGYLNEYGHKGIELPVLVHLIGYQILNWAGQSDAALRQEADSFLENGHALLEERLQRLPEEAICQRFLHNLPYNYELRQLWLANQAR
ncbi:MAG: tetratricopeptide repeat protein [Candidatus Promineifilaceae bacterium]